MFEPGSTLKWWEGFETCQVLNPLHLGFVSIPVFGGINSLLRVLATLFNSLEDGLTVSTSHLLELIIVHS